MGDLQWHDACCLYLEMDDGSRVDHYWLSFADLRFSKVLCVLVSSVRRFCLGLSAAVGKCRLLEEIVVQSLLE